MLGKNTLLALDEASVSKWKYDDNANILTFPNTTFKYRKTKKTLRECIDTLPKELRKEFKEFKEFKENIITVIKEMHKLGIALGAPNKYKAGYRTFKQQFDLPANVTKAGPGESFHNYGLAVDLGIIDWVDLAGKNHSDFWFGTMDSMKQYKGFSSKIWSKRNEFIGKDIHKLSWEIIHLQSLPASTSGRSALVAYLNEAAKDSSMRYRKSSGNTYECQLSKEGKWINIGSAKDLWSGNIKTVSINAKNSIISHMQSAENIAKTIKL